MTDSSWNSWNPKGSFTQAIFVAATRCNFCRGKAATSFKHRVRKTPAISRRQIALKISPALQVRFWSCNLRATKIASNCRDKNSLCKWALTNHNMEYRYYKEERSSSHILPLFSIPKCVDYAASLSSVLLSSYCRHSSSVVGCRSSVDKVFGLVHNHRDYCHRLRRHHFRLGRRYCRRFSPYSPCS